MLYGSDLVIPGIQPSKEDDKDAGEDELDPEEDSSSESESEDSSDTSSDAATTTSAETQKDTAPAAQPPKAPVKRQALGAELRQMACISKPPASGASVASTGAAVTAALPAAKTAAVEMQINKQGSVAPAAAKVQAARPPATPQAPTAAPKAMAKTGYGWIDFEDFKNSWYAEEVDFFKNDTTPKRMHLNSTPAVEKPEDTNTTTAAEEQDADDFGAEPMEVTGAKVHEYDQKTLCVACDRYFLCFEKVLVYPDGSAQHVQCHESGTFTKAVETTAPVRAAASVSSQSASRNETKNASETKNARDAAKAKEVFVFFTHGPIEADVGLDASWSSLVHRSTSGPIWAGVGLDEGRSAHSGPCSIALLDSYLVHFEMFIG